MTAIRQPKKSLIDPAGIFWATAAPAYAPIAAPVPYATRNGSETFPRPAWIPAPANDVRTMAKSEVAIA